MESVGGSSLGPVLLRFPTFPFWHLQKWLFNATHEIDQLLLIKSSDPVLFATETRSTRYLHWRAEVLAARGFTVLIADLLGDEREP